MLPKPEDIENELNERLELACSITEAWKFVLDISNFYV